MATSSLPPETEEWTSREADRHVVPVLVLDFADERTRYRRREATLISIIAHLVMFIALWLSPPWFKNKAMQVFTARDLINQRELTYLDLPHDRQSVSKRPNTNIISDKDRIATSRHPVLDRKTLQELRDSARPGAPNPPGPPQMQAPPSAPAAAPQAAQAGSGAPPKPSQNNNQMARLEPPPAAGKNVFGEAMSAGSAIEQATRAAAANRVAGGGGAAGDYGIGTGRANSSVQSNMDVLSDTMGVDFGPYLARVLHDVRINWYNLIPEVARPPLMKRGKVSIEFAILKDGSVAGMKLAGPSGDISLDRAAWGGINASNPFPPLPSEFQGQYLALRFHFYYNPDLSDLR